jgi:hypothetical protein
MSVRLQAVVAVASALVIATACSRSSGPSHPVIRLNTSHAGPAYVEVAGLSNDLLEAIEDARLTPEQWADVLRVSVEAGAPAMLGRYRVADDTVKFEPAFPLDPGRQYQVRFDPARVIAASGGGGAGPLEATVGLPASDRTPSAVVTRVYPTGDVIPENFLRMYIEFSAPMGRRSGLEYMKLLDESGKEIEGAFLPLDYEFWSPDHRRFTVFFDPGRVKDGILPNRQMGRALHPGRTVTLLISQEWRDEHGQPLKEEFRRVFRVGPPDTQPLDTSSWRIQAPAAGTRDAVVAAFPEPLDHGLLMRALGIRRHGETVDGEVVVDAGETRWAFVPRDPWPAGDHELLALDILEDLAGNEIGRAFEVDNFDTVDKSPNPQTITIPFHVRAR